MGFWNKSVWWIAAFVALVCLFALTQTAQTGSAPVPMATPSGPADLMILGDGPPEGGYGAAGEGQSMVYDRVPGG
jgi:hypothetical protein